MNLQRNELTVILSKWKSLLSMQTLNRRNILSNYSWSFWTTKNTLWNPHRVVTEFNKRNWSDSFANILSTLYQDEEMFKLRSRKRRQKRNRWTSLKKTQTNLRVNHKSNQIISISWRWKYFILSTAFQRKDNIRFGKCFIQYSNSSNDNITNDHHHY